MKKQIKIYFILLYILKIRFDTQIFKKKNNA